MFGEKIEFVIRHLLTSCKRAVISTLAKMFCLSVMHRMVVYMMRVPTHSTTLIEETKKVKKVLMMTRMNYRCCCVLFVLRFPGKNGSKGSNRTSSCNQSPIDKLMHYDFLLFACMLAFIFILLILSAVCSVLMLNNLWGHDGKKTNMFGLFVNYRIKGVS